MCTELTTGGAVVVVLVVDEVVDVDVDVDVDVVDSGTVLEVVGTSVVVTSVEVVIVGTTIDEVVGLDVEPSPTSIVCSGTVGVAIAMLV